MDKVYFIELIPFTPKQISEQILRLNQKISKEKCINFSINFWSENLFEWNHFNKLLVFLINKWIYKVFV